MSLVKDIVSHTSAEMPWVSAAAFTPDMVTDELKLITVRRVVFNLLFIYLLNFLFIYFFFSFFFLFFLQGGGGGGGGEGEERNGLGEAGGEGMEEGSERFLRIHNTDLPFLYN